MNTYLTISLITLALLSGCSTGRNGVTINIQGAETGGDGITIHTYQGVNRASVGQGNDVEAQSDVKPSTTADVSATGL